MRAVNEIGFKPKMIGGAMVGPQNTSMKAQLGPLLNGFVNYETYIPAPKLNFPGVSDMLKKYQDRAKAEGVDPFGYYMGTLAYAQLQVLGQAIENTKGLDDKKLAENIHSASFKTVMGDVKFDKTGEWATSRVLQVQFRNIKGNAVDQFKGTDTQVVIAPSDYASGQLVYPYEKAK